MELSFNFRNKLVGCFVFLQMVFTSHTSYLVSAKRDVGLMQQHAVMTDKSAHMMAIDLAIQLLIIRRVT